MGSIDPVQAPISRIDFIGTGQLLLIERAVHRVEKGLVVKWLN
jgi:hypothetical protein